MKPSPPKRKSVQEPATDSVIKRTKSVVNLPLVFPSLSELPLSIKLVSKQITDQLDSIRELVHPQVFTGALHHALSTDPSYDHYHVRYIFVRSSLSTVYAYAVFNDSYTQTVLNYFSYSCSKEGLVSYLGLYTRSKLDNHQRIYGEENYVVNHKPITSYQLAEFVDCTACNETFFNAEEDIEQKHLICGCDPLLKKSRKLVPGGATYSIEEESKIVEGKEEDKKLKEKKEDKHLKEEDEEEEEEEDEAED